MTVQALRFVLGDQLTEDLQVLQSTDRRQDVVLMAEVAEETTYAPHHKKKIAFIFAAMRSFAESLRSQGWTVDYITLDDPANTGSLTTELARAVARHRPRRIEATEASEWRVLQAQKAWADSIRIHVHLHKDTRFLCSREEFETWAQGRNQLRMEYFYRTMRLKTGLLMEGDKPAGGQWNFDHDNRKRAKSDLFMSQPLRFEPTPIVETVVRLVSQRFADHYGDLEPFWFPVTKADAETAAAHFMAHMLPSFGDFQDAMVRGQRFLFHSVLSPCLNVGLLDPLTLCQQAEEEFKQGRAPLNAVEGFIRQIIGWREFVRGIYWLKMPGYTNENALGARRPLPSMYWTGETDMTCMAEAFTQTREEAYAHHIQRLMVTGNFALLAGIDPHAVHEWYLSVYADAFEWVEAPNTIGMSQFADGGLLGSKPYAASGAYIDRMSDYCSGCRYTVKQRTGKNACPFNALYWDFLARHRARFEANPRMAQMYRTYDRLGTEEHTKISAHAKSILDHLDQHGTDKSPR
jgi:deoxyribodipyrimidine photolyase-related protein